MAVKIRLKRMGKIRAPFYRVVVMDSRQKRDGRAIEEIGKYHPTSEPSLIDIDSERAQYWLGVGAQPTEQVAALLKVTGDWQKHKGEDGAEGTLRHAEPAPDKRALYEAALAKAGGDDTPTATTPRRSRGQKAEAPAAAEASPASNDAASSEAAPEKAAPTTPAEGEQATSADSAAGSDAAEAAPETPATTDEA